MSLNSFGGLNRSPVDFRVRHEADPEDRPGLHVAQGAPSARYRSSGPRPCSARCPTRRRTAPPYRLPCAYRIHRSTPRTARSAAGHSRGRHCAALVELDLLEAFLARRTRCLGFRCGVGYVAGPHPTLGQDGGTRPGFKRLGAHPGTAAPRSRAPRTPPRRRGRGRWRPRRGAGACGTGPGCRGRGRGRR